MKRLILFILLFSQLIHVVNIKAEEIPLSQAIKNFAQDRKGTRVAVFNFINASGTKSPYDTYIADTLITELSNYQLTLLERSRLELLLKEHTLSQTGVVDSERAVELGKLLPVDVIVSGSYTETSDRVIINGRFVHVSTGEILYAFTSSIKNITKADNSPTADNTDNDLRRAQKECDEKKDKVKKAMSSLRTQSQINNAVNMAIDIPFEGDCGKIHYEVMYIFVRSNIYPVTYRDFLIKTLLSIEKPSSDIRTREILRYFASDKKVDDWEWSASVEIFKKCESTIHIPLYYMINNKYEKKAVIMKRADEIMKLAVENRIGQPVAIASEKILFALLHTLKSYPAEKDMENAVNIFKNYMHLIPDAEESNKKAAQYLKSIYFDEKNTSTLKKIADVIITFYSNRVDSIEIVEETAGFLKSMDVYIHEKQGIDNPLKDIYTSHQKLFNKGLEKAFCSSIENAKKNGYKSQIDERILYVLKNNLSCPNAQTLDDLKNDMQSRDWDKKIKAAEMLSKIGTGAKPLEKVLITYLGQEGYGSEGGKLRSLCAKTLGNIKTNNPEGIQLLIESFPDYDHGVSYAAEEAIKKIGEPAIPFLIKGLSHEHHAVRLRCAVALGNLGRKSRNALPELEKLANNDSNPYVKKQARGSIIMIKNDF